ncbi:MAG: alpha/beta hydrolase [Actinomycetota bacterium]|nr:alpha/beta hydrolase [Actinomycetota bacterium]
MATFVLIHGAGSDGWYWHLVAPLLREHGHDVVAPDLPVGDDRAGLAEYAEVVSNAAADRSDVVIVAQSLGGFTAPLVAERLGATLIVMVNAMTPYPKESPGEWWANAGWDGAIPETDEAVREIFLHDLPDDVAAESAHHAVPQSGTPFARPWPFDEWPEVPTRFLAGRDDRLFTLDFQQRVARERLGVEVDAMEGGHLVALARPAELADRLVSYAAVPEAASRPRFRR